MLIVQDVTLNDINQERWSQLLAKSRCGSFFQSYEWIKLWLTHFSNTLERTLILAVYDEGELIGIAPFAINSQVVHFLTVSAVHLGNTLADFGDIIALQNKEEVVFKAIFDYISQLMITGRYQLQLDNVRKNSSCYNFLLKQNNVQLKLIEVAPKIILPADWDGYLAALNSHERHEFKRKLKLARQCELKLSAKPLENIQTDFRRLIACSFPRKENFSSSLMIDFIIDLISLDAVDLFFLFNKGELIASLITINDREDVLAYNSFYNPDFKDLSPGIVLFGLVIQKAISNQKQAFDFLRGNESYKYRLGAVDQPLYCAEIKE